MPLSDLTLQDLSACFHMPARDAAKQLGMCVTSLKKLMRKFGISRWPARKIKSLRTVSMDQSPPALVVPSRTSGTHAQPEASEDSSSHAADCKPGREGKRERDPSFTPKAETAIERDASGVWPTFSVSGLNMQTLVVANWSTLWSVQHLRKYILEPANGDSVSISDDGSKAYLSFHTQLAAVQARALCLEACRKVLERDGAARPGPSKTVVSKVEQWLPHSESPSSAGACPGSDRAAAEAGGETSKRLSPCLFRGDEESEESDHDDAVSEASAGDCQDIPVAIRDEQEEEEGSSGEPGNGQASRAGAGAAEPAPCKQELGELSLVCRQEEAARAGLEGGAPCPRWGSHRRDTPTHEGGRYTSGDTRNPQQTSAISSPSAAPVASPRPIQPLGVLDAPPTYDVGGDNMSLSHVSAIMSCGSERGFKATSSVARCAG